MPKEKTTKEKLLEEFNEFTKTLEADFITEGYSAYGDLEDFISQTIDRVREETIREVEGILEEITPAYIGVLESNNDRRYYEQGFGEYKEEIKQSLKSLINK